MENYRLNHLKQLEHEAIFILRETVAQFERPVLMFSGGKDSITLVHLAQKAFYPARIPFPILHIDTGHNFPEVLCFRDQLAKKLKLSLLVRKVQDTIDSGKAVEEKGPNSSRNALQTITLLDAIAESQFDAAIGGARRDEEKARAKERFFSHRDEFGQWDPKNQRPELWHIFNGKKQMGEHFRVFPLSNWTEIDIWQYLEIEKIHVPNIYFSHRREVFKRRAMLLPKSPYLKLEKDEHYEKKTIRFRTIGDMTCTGAIESKANNIKKIIQELHASRITERGSRFDDLRSETAMEDRKRQGYF